MNTIFLKIQFHIIIHLQFNKHISICTTIREQEIIERRRHKLFLATGQALSLVYIILKILCTNGRGDIYYVGTLSFKIILHEHKYCIMLCYIIRWRKCVFSGSI